LAILKKPGERCRAGAPRPEPHFALRAVRQDDLAVRWLEAARERRASAPPAFELAEHELDVLAGTQRVGGEVGATAVVVARPGAADAHSVRVARLGVRHLEI
jgi:hypothetical protein